MLENKGDAHHQLEAESNSTSSPPRNPGAGRTKIDVQDAYRLRFQRFLIPWKDNFITFPMPPVFTSKFHRSQRETSKQVSIQNLPGCCVTVFWPVGPCIVLESIRGASRGLACP